MKDWICILYNWVYTSGVEALKVFVVGNFHSFDKTSIDVLKELTMRAPTEILFPELHATKTGRRNCHGNNAVPGKGGMVLVRKIQSNAQPYPFVY